MCQHRPTAVIAATYGLLLLWIAAAFAAPDFPQLTGRVVDQAGLLDAGTRASLSKKLEALEKQTTDQLVVVTLKSLQGETIETYGYQLGRHWGIGQKEKNNGALLIVAAKERKVRIEVGYGLEGVLTDALTKLIIDSAIVPRFRAGDFPGGITAGATDLITALTSGTETLMARQPAADPVRHQELIDTIFTIIVILIIIWHIYAVFSGRSAWLGRSGSTSSGGWSSGGGGWSGGGGGGFGGGGGSFGGGGSSGGW
ncbi:MAG: TPM domain-containing protein [Pseudomonadota bacterium]